MCPPKNVQKVTKTFDPVYPEKKIEQVLPSELIQLSRQVTYQGIGFEQFFSACSP